MWSLEREFVTPGSPWHSTPAAAIKRSAKLGHTNMRYVENQGRARPITRELWNWDDLETIVYFNTACGNLADWKFKDRMCFEAEAADPPWAHGGRCLEDAQATIEGNNVNWNPHPTSMYARRRDDPKTTSGLERTLPHQP
jgi:hypothetical protein